MNLHQYSKVGGRWRGRGGNVFFEWGEWDRGGGCREVGGGGGERGRRVVPFSFFWGGGGGGGGGGGRPGGGGGATGGGGWCVGKDSTLTICRVGNEASVAAAVQVYGRPSGPQAAPGNVLRFIEISGPGDGRLVRCPEASWFESMSGSQHMGCRSSIFQTPSTFYLPAVMGPPSSV